MTCSRRWKVLEVMESHIPLLKYSGHGSAVIEKARRKKREYFPRRNSNIVVYGKGWKKVCILHRSSSRDVRKCTVH